MLGALVTNSLLAYMVLQLLLMLIVTHAHIWNPSLGNATFVRACMRACKSTVKFAPT